MLQAIHTRAPGARVLLVGYPDMFPQQGGCWPAVPITDGDIAYLRGIEGQINGMLARAAAATGTTFVDTYTPTIGHDFCQHPDVRDVEGLIPGSLTVPFHPNTRGQAAIAAAVLAALGVGQPLDAQPAGDAASSARRACTWAADGLTMVLPSEKSRVGTVWLPPLTLITNSAAAGSRSMSTSVISMPTRLSCAFRRLQNPHH